MAPMKCKKGFKMRSGRCVKARGESFFKPKSDLKKGILWTALIAVVLSGILGATFFLFGEFNDTAVKIISTTSIIGIGAMLVLGFTRFKDAVVSWSTITSTASVTLLFVLNIWDITNFGWEKVWLTAGLLAIGNVIGLLSYADKNMFLKYGGSITTVISVLIWKGLIWEWLVSTDTLLRLVLILSVVAFALAHISLINGSKGSRDNLVKIIFWIVIGLITIVTGMLVYLIFNVHNVDFGDMFFRVLGFVGILDIAGSITLPILKKVRG